MEEWLISFFGDYETAVANAHLYSLEFSPFTSRTTEDGMFISTQTVTIKRKDKA